MEGPEKKEPGNQKVTKVKIFPVPLELGNFKDIISIDTNIPSRQSKEKVINQALKFHSEGNITEAAKNYQLFINQGYNDQRVFSNYGIILSDLGKGKEAELYLRKAIQMNPDSAEAYSNLGLLLKKLGNLQEAEVSTRKAIELNPSLENAYLNLGIIFLDLGKLQEAEASTRKAIELNSNCAEAYSNLGIILSALEKIDEAILNYERSLSIKPTMTEALVGLGKLLLIKGKYIKGLHLLKKGDGVISFDLDSGVSVYQ